MNQILSRHELYPSYADVAVLDPLRVDEAMTTLPNLNSRGDLDSLRMLTAFAVSMASTIESPDKAEALAAIRDLDFLASSVLRHGEDPVRSVFGLEGQLLRMGAVADTIPRGTVFTYASANPSNQRRRYFTGQHEEEVFIDSVTRSIAALDGAVYTLSVAELGMDASLAEALERSSEAMHEMVESIVRVKRTVSPEFFTFQMRPYFEPLTVGGRTLTGAGGAQMQLVAIDRMLWGCEDRTLEYERFFQENSMYLTPVQRAALARYEEINGNQSIVGWLYKNRGSFPAAHDAALNLLNDVRKFRYPHRRVAQDNFKIRPNDAVGSGTYKPDILDVLIEKTEASIAMLREADNDKD